MPMKKFRMTSTELKLKRERMNKVFHAGKKAVEELGLPYFLSYASALAVLRDGQFQPFEDDISVGVYSWDIVTMQRACPGCSAKARDSRMISVFDTCGFDPVSEMERGEEPGEKTIANMVCPRTFLAEGWHQEAAFPILYKFTHRECLVKFNVVVFTLQFGQLWDFADGGAETSSGWRYKAFSPQPIEFEKTATFVMPPAALEEHYGQDWHVPAAEGYIANLSRCKNRCQVLRVHPWDINMQKQTLPEAVPWEDFRNEVKRHRINYAKAMGDQPAEVPEKPLELYKIESKPLVLFQAIEMCKAEGNERLRKGNAAGALSRYDEGIYILDKCREVLVTWRLVFRQIHVEKAEQNRKDRGLKLSDMEEPDMPNEFRSDEVEERQHRLALLLNAAQAALQLENWEVVESRASQALELDQRSLKALFRRGTARLRAGREHLARADFWSMVKHSNFESKEALNQLMKLMPKDEVQKEMRKLKASMNKESRLGDLLTGMEKDNRISAQSERYQRYAADCEQRKADGLREISFDDWALQYEWRYDADERAKARAAFPECFSHIGPAPLPVEPWEVDYLTHREISKIMYRRETAALGARRREREGNPQQPVVIEKESFDCKLELDEEDEELFREGAAKKGYNYWW